MAYDLTLDVATIQNTYGVPAELLADLQEVKDNFGDAFFGNAYPRISLRGSRFILKRDGVEELLDTQRITGVILAHAKVDHCIWYKNSYDPNVTDAKPDALWLADGEVPSNVPTEIIKTKRPDGKLWYTRQHRLVIALVDKNNILDIEHPIVFDVGSMSLYGDDVPLASGNKALNYSNFVRYVNGTGLLIPMIPVGIILHPTASVPTVRFVPAVQDGKPVIFPVDQLRSIINMSKSDLVKDMVKVDLIGDFGPKSELDTFDEPSQPKKTRARKAPTAPTASQPSVPPTQDVPPVASQPSVPPVQAVTPQVQEVVQPTQVATPPVQTVTQQQAQPQVQQQPLQQAQSTLNNTPSAAVVGNQLQELLARVSAVK